MSEPEDKTDPLPEARPPAQEPARPAPAVPVVVPRWVQLVTVLLGGFALYAIAHAAGPVLLLFITAAIIALILNPVVAALQRLRVPRGLAILIVYAGFFATLAFVGTLLVNPVAEQFSKFRDDVPSIVRSANDRLADVQDYFDRKNINIEVKKQGQTALQTLQQRVVGGTGQVVSFGPDLVTRPVTPGLGLILLFVLSGDMLLYGERVGAA